MDRPDDEDPETYQVAADQTVSEAVVYAVSDATDADPLDLEPLYTAVDPDSLDALYARHGPGRPAELTFTFSGHEVTVLSDGRIRVEGRTAD